MSVLAIGAHPDDIEIACSGTLAKCAARGDKVIVCHVSSGNLGHVIIPPDELRKIRAEEAKKAGAMAGIEVISAGFDDLEIFDNNVSENTQRYRKRQKQLSARRGIRGDAGDESGRKKGYKSFFAGKRINDKSTGTVLSVKETCRILKTA